MASPSEDKIESISQLPNRLIEIGRLAMASFSSNQ